MRYFAANRYDFSDGSIMLTCSIHDGSREYSNAYFFDKETPTTEQYCYLGYEVDAAAPMGVWEFNVPLAGASIAQYSDPGSASHGTYLTLTCVRQ